VPFSFPLYPQKVYSCFIQSQHQNFFVCRVQDVQDIGASYVTKPYLVQVFFPGIKNKLLEIHIFRLENPWFPFGPDNVEHQNTPNEMYNADKII
jgi:hypothetical protein